MSDAMIGKGTLFKVSTDGGTTYTALAAVISISPPSDNIDIIDVTSMDSGSTREFITGLIDPGECSFEMNFVPGSASDVKIREIRDAGETISAQIVFNTTPAVTWEFDCLLSGYVPAVPADDKMTATVTFKVTGSYEVS